MDEDEILHCRLLIIKVKTFSFRIYFPEIIPFLARKNSILSYFSVLALLL
jgi:hypothetical protein